MEFKETAAIMALIASNYSEKLLPSPWVENQRKAVEAWHDLLKDLDHDKVKAAVASLIMTKNYPPTIADIRGMIAKAAEPVTTVTSEEAWGLIQKAVRKFGYPDENGALEFIGEPARTIVKRFGWLYFCQMPNEEHSTYFSQFRRAYDAEILKRIERVQIPKELRDRLEGIGSGTNEVLKLEESHD